VTGLVVDSGASVTTVVPVLEGYMDASRVKRLNIAGNHITQRLRHLVQFKGHDVSGSSDALFQKMKERCCYTAVNIERETMVRTHTVA
jgi:actin-related protein